MPRLREDPAGLLMWRWELRRRLRSNGERRNRRWTPLTATPATSATESRRDLDWERPVGTSRYVVVHDPGLFRTGASLGASDFPSAFVCVRAVRRGSAYSAAQSVRPCAEGR